MIKLHIFGSCSGTEPFPERHHCSFAVEADGMLYWFDAGENCSFTAHNMGLDLLKIREIFISHPHMDHVGGLGNLLWNIRKLSVVNNRIPECGSVEVITPSISSFNAQMGVLKETEGNFKCSFPVTARETHDGVIFDDGKVRVEALHNHHLAHNDGDKWMSYSFRITACGKTVLFSGDVKSIEDFEAFLKDGCDMLLMETGHHDPVSVAEWLNEHKDYKLGRLVFIHHGRHILDRCDEKTAQLDSVFAGKYIISEDAMTLEI